MDLGLHDRVFIITGGSRGLGYATAQSLVAEGARVVLVGRDQDSLAAAAVTLGTHATVLRGDTSDSHLPDEAIDRARSTFGRVDGALISGGGPPPGTAMHVTDAQWRDAFDTVFLGGLRMARTLLDSGTSISIAWVLSTSAVELITGLGASNGFRPGLAMLIKDLADEVAPLASRVNGLLPGRIATDRIAEIDAALGDDARTRQQGAIPMGRYGEPREFGQVAAFVLSPAASYITGTLIRIDGGLTRHP
ncbi:MAG: SDR family oxidoreductase [Candidatus Nanopelagicales bacterium]|jgi:3-oxoacyl-[acyl-carrier protein] reductase|nr:SDR family oxidoreductase [Candidatus Nanopelagicales bacterium]